MKTSDYDFLFMLTISFQMIDNCRSQGIHFQPLVVETFGGWDKDALSFLKTIAHQAARRWGRNNALEIKQFFQRLSVALQRGNASLLINRDAEIN